MRGELGLDAEARLLGVALGLRTDRFGIRLRFSPTRPNLFACRLEQALGLHGRILDEHARLALGDAQNLFELLTTLGCFGCRTDELVRQRLHLLLDIRGLRLCLAQVGLELLDRLPRLRQLTTAGGRRLLAAPDARLERRDAIAALLQAGRQGRHGGIDLVLLIAPKSRRE